MNDPIFKPIKINDLEVKNRIYMPAMHLGMASEGHITDKLVDFYAERARGGAGIISVGFATVNEFAGGMHNLIGAHNDDFLPGLARLATAVKQNGSRAMLQINHAGANAFSGFIDGKQPVSSSDVPGMSKETPRALTLDEIQQTLSDFARTAIRVKEAGYDAVEVLSGTGYLISQFLSPLTNKREDEYGGSFANRMRFGLEVMTSIREAVGDDFPLVARINGNEFMPGGLGRRELQEYAKKLAEIGTVNALCINVGWHQAKVPQIVASVPRGVFAYLSKGIKECVDIPVISSHRINDVVTARELIGDGMCDMVAIGRGLIADPYLPEKTRTGREDEIVHCIACAQGCFDLMFKMSHVECMCNPKAGHEKERHIEKTTSPKKIMVIGGGPAGMSAALAANERGHDVTVYEKSSRLGGQLYLAACPPGREEFAELAKDLGKQLQVNDIPVVLNQTIDGALIEKERPDVVLLATGAKPITPPIPGVDLDHVVQAWDVLQDKVYTGKKVVIIGGNAVGVETALFLAEKGTLSGDAIKFLLLNRAESPEDLYELATKGTKEIIMVEMINRIGTDIGRTSRWGMMQDLSRFGVASRVETVAMEITESGVKVESRGVFEEISADTVVLAAGSKPNNPLEDILKEKGIPYQVIGDAGQIGQAFDAVHKGFSAGKDL